MATNKVDFAGVLRKCEAIVKEMGLTIHFTHNLDPFFKGDLDGKTIIIGFHLSAEEKLFNLLHLAGHSIQWNTNPDDKLLKKLQTYEWQANCYALSILHKAKIFDLDDWLTAKYITDMLYLTHFYKTGEKLKRITKVAKAYPFKRKLMRKTIPPFAPKAAKRTRNGLVISFE
jgi:hypothetical protein